MKQKFFLSLLIAGLSVFLGGCVHTVDGHYKAGSPVGKDKIYSRYERTPEQIMTAAHTAVSDNGKILNEDPQKGTIKGNVNNRCVFIKVCKVDNNVSEVVVQVRKKFGGGDIYWASEISKQI